MSRVLFFLVLLASSLVAYVDSDMDGVPDQSDKCANTPLTELVDLSGCTIKKLVSEHHFDVVLGESYATDTNTTLNLSSLRVDYYYKNWSFQLASSYYSNKDLNVTSSGLNDTYLNFSYLLNPMNNFYLNIGGGVVFPTYDSADNEVDYTASLYGRYKWDDLSLTLGLGYGKTGDTNSENSISYNDTLSYNVGLGYSWNSKFYSSIGYAKVNSIFEGVDDLESLSLYGYYGIDEHWFTNLNYRYGMVKDDPKQTVGVNLGYYW